MNKDLVCFLIDDDLDDQEIFLMALEEIDNKISCVTVNNAIDAIEKLKSEIPDFIFIDVNMPKMNGIQCLKEVRAMKHLQKSKVIMYSTASDKRIVDSSKELGADEFIVKPAEFSVLIERVSAIVKTVD